MRWLDTSDRDTEKSADAFWKRKAAEINSEQFWADAIRHLRAQPCRRLDLALDNLPLPHAFEEAAAAQFDIISQKKAANIHCRRDLTFLYWLAAVRSFLVPYAAKLQEPGFNVVESIPCSVLKAIPLPWHELGYEQLQLINEISAQWLIEQWGKPKAHTTLFALRNDLWIEYEDRLIASRKSDWDSLIAGIPPQ
jgi:hypothetical protein